MMKIQVGKVYRDQLKRPWLIECELSRKGSFMGSAAGNAAGEMMFATFTGAGLREWMYNGKPVSDDNANNLVPNIVKKEGWVIVSLRSDQTDRLCSPCTPPGTPYNFFRTEKEAEAWIAARVPAAVVSKRYVACKIEYEVEE